LELTIFVRAKRSNDAREKRQGLSGARGKLGCDGYGGTEEPEGGEPTSGNEGRRRPNSGDCLILEVYCFIS